MGTSKTWKRKMVTDEKKNIGANDEEQELEELFASYVDRLNQGDELNP